MTAAELLGVQVLYVGGGIYLAAVFVECVLTIRRDAQSACNAREHPKAVQTPKVRQKRCNGRKRGSGELRRVR